MMLEKHFKQQILLLIVQELKKVRQEGKIGNLCFPMQNRIQVSLVNLLRRGRTYSSPMPRNPPQLRFLAHPAVCVLNFQSADVHRSMPQLSSYKYNDFCRRTIFPPKLPLQVSLTEDREQLPTNTLHHMKKIIGY